jgi:FkbM family methyltransferase
VSFRSFVKALLSNLPGLEVLFRRHVWSRWHFPEREMLFLDGLPSDSIDVAIDVGGALGGYSWILSRKSRRVIVFEPGKTHADFMARGIGGTNIELHRAAVGESEGTVSLHTPGDDEHARHSATVSRDNPVVAEHSTRVTHVPQICLDQFLDEQLGPDEKVDILKVDVEGYEQAVFNGACKLIQRDYPLIIAEIEARHNAQYRDLFEMMRKFGYAVYIYRNDDFEPFEGTDISSLQSDAELAKRLSSDYRHGDSNYINNFVFQHVESRVKVSVS